MTPLTSKQLDILNLLYRFRFVTSGQLSQILEVSKATVNWRLKLMQDKGYIGRKYEPKYHLERKHASYYLLSEGVKALKKQNSKNYNSTVLSNLSNDKKRSETFVDHCLAVSDVFCIMHEQHGSTLQFFTKTQLAGRKIFPNPLPDAHIQLETEEGKHLYFLDVLHEARPFFLATRRIIQYIEFAKKETWPAKYEFPSMLLVCDTQALKKRLIKRVRQTVENASNDGLRFFICTIDQFKEDIWHDMADPDDERSLSSI